MKKELGEPLTMAELLTTAKFLTEADKTFHVISVQTPASSCFSPDQALILVNFSGEMFFRAFILRREALDPVFRACETGELKDATFIFDNSSAGVRLVKPL